MAAKIGALPKAYLTAVAGLTLVLTSPAMAYQVTDELEASPALCAEGDPNPEPGHQGDVPQGTTPAWDCGVRRIGFLAGADGAMAVAGHCAYTGVGLPVGSTGDGVRVLDVSDPTNPVLVRTLDTSSRELLAAQVTDERALLATRRRADQVLSDLGQADMLIDVWDIAECTDPQLLGTATIEAPVSIPGELGGPAHNLKFNPSATKLYGSLPPHEIDLADLSDPSSWTIRNLHCGIVDQSDAVIAQVPGTCAAASAPNGNAGMLPSISHEPTFSPDGTRLYLGSQVPAPNSNAMWILDMTGPDPVLISKREETPGHSIDYMTVDGRTYLLHSNELGGNACIPAEVRPRYVGYGDRAWILDITDETAPDEVAEIILEASTLEACNVDSPGGPNIAYHDVDDPLDTTYAVIGFGPAGFRFFDLRDPANPAEIAYYNHGPSTHTKPYIIPETGHIWANDTNGFNVLELEPQVVARLGGAPPVPAPAPDTTTAPAATGSSGGALPATGSPPGLVAAGLAAAVAAGLGWRARRPRS